MGILWVLVGRQQSDSRNTCIDRKIFLHSSAKTSPRSASSAYVGARVSHAKKRGRLLHPPRDSRAAIFCASRLQGSWQHNLRGGRNQHPVVLVIEAFNVVLPEVAAGLDLHNHEGYLAGVVQAMDLPQLDEYGRVLLQQGTVRDRAPRHQGQALHSDNGVIRMERQRNSQRLSPPFRTHQLAFMRARKLQHEKTLRRLPRNAVFAEETFATLAQIPFSLPYAMLHLYTNPHDKDFCLVVIADFLNKYGSRKVKSMLPKLAFFTPDMPLRLAQKLERASADALTFTTSRGHTTAWAV